MECDIIFDDNENNNMKSYNSYFVASLRNLQEEMTVPPTANTILENYTNAKITTNKKPYCLVSCQQQVSRAITQGAYTPISRILNKFPTDVVPYPYDKDAMADFVKSFNDILTQGEEISRGEDGNFNVSKERELELENFVNALISYACEEILDGAGQVKSQIIEILGLQRLLNEANRFSGNVLLEIRQPLISSYLSQILLLQILHLWSQFHEVKYKESGRLEKGPAELSHYIEQKIGKGVSPVYLNKINSYPVYGRPLAASCAMLLVTLHTQIKKILQEDFQPLTTAQRVMIPIKLQQDWFKARIIFWNDVFHFMSLHHKNAYEIEKMEANAHADMVRQEIRTESVEEALATITEDAELKYMWEAAYNSKVSFREKTFLHLAEVRYANGLRIIGSLKSLMVSISAVEYKKSFTFFKKEPASSQTSQSELSSIPELHKWFLVRDNFILIQNILRDVAEQKLGQVFGNLLGETLARFVENEFPYIHLTPDEEKVLKELDESRFNLELITLNGKTLLEKFIAKCDPAAPLYSILNKYKIFLEVSSTNVTVQSNDRYVPNNLIRLT